MQNLVIDVSFIIRKLMAQLPGDIFRHFRFINHFDSAEYNDTFKIQRPTAVFLHTFIQYTVRCTVILFQRVHLMAVPAAVKVDPVIGFTVVMIQRNAVRISIITVYRQHAAHGFMKDFPAFFLRQFLTESDQFSEHVDIL